MRQRSLKEFFTHKKQRFQPHKDKKPAADRAKRILRELLRGLIVYWIVCFVLAFIFLILVALSALTWKFSADLLKAQNVRVARFGMRLLEFREQLHSGAKASRIPYVALALHHPDWKVRGDAIAWLGKFSKPEITKLVLPRLMDENPYVLNRVIDTLAKQKDPPIYPIMLALRHRLYWVRRNTAKALGEIKNPLALESLIASLRDPYPSVRQEAIKALQSLGDSQAIGPLIEMLVCWDAPTRDLAREALINFGFAAHNKIWEATFSSNLNLQKEALIVLKDLDEETAQMRSQRLKEENATRKTLADDLYKEAESAFQEGRYQESIGLLNQALSLDPYNLEVLRLKGQALFKTSLHDEALEVYEKALFIKPDDIVSLRGKGRILQAQKRESQLRDLYDLARNLNPVRALTWKGWEDFLWKED